MAEPKKKLSRARRGWRRSHDALRQMPVSICPKCKQPKLPHYVCLHCGYYKGKEILKVK